MKLFEAMMLFEGAFAAGEQCARRLWLERRGSDTASSDVRDHGRNVLEPLLPELHPGARDVRALPFEEARTATQAWLAGGSEPALLGGALAREALCARIDALVRDPDDELALERLSAELRVRDDVLEEAAAQLWVLRGAGSDANRVSVLHPDADFVRGAASPRADELLVRHDVSSDARLLAGDTEAHLADFLRMLAGPEPAIDPSPHCFAPQRCPYWERCTGTRPPDGIERLPGLRPATYAALRAAGADRIGDIAEDVPLSPRQELARAAHREGGVMVAPELGAELAASRPPAAYLDFEAFAPVLPAYPGMGPLQAIPFSFSLHVDEGGGRLEHHEFLAAGGADPREPLARALVAALGEGSAPVVVYSGFEGAVLDELGAALPELAEALGRIAARLFDLLPVVRDGVYHPDFGGSYSLKVVAPALVAGTGYDDLGPVADGAAAAAAVAELLFGKPDDPTSLRRELAAYCARDTLMLAHVHRALLALADSG